MKKTYYKLLVRSTLLFLVSGGLACQPEEASETTSRPPNVLFIIIDDLNDAVTGLNGHPQAKTPNIDRLMQRGVTFTNAHSNDPLCAPSRASLITGLYPHTSGYFGGLAYNFRQNPVLKDSRTFVEHFRDHGYQVFGTGKILHHATPDSAIWINQDGEYGYGIPASFGPYPWDGRDSSVTGHNVPHPQLPPALFVGNVASNYADVTATPLSNVPVHQPDPAEGVPGYQGWRLFRQPFRYENEDDRDLMPDERYARWTVDRLQQVHKKPFLLCVGFVRPHVPHVAPQRYFDQFPLDSVQLAKTLPNDTADCAEALVYDYNYGNGSRDGLTNYQHTVEAKWLKQWTQAYLACVAFVDDQIGLVLDALEASPYADNTIIVLTSDHGYHMGEKNWLYKNSLWEESTRIPFVWAGPDIAVGARTDQPVSLIDVYPTLVDLCDLPAQPNATTNQVALDGYSVRPFLENPATAEWEGPDAALTYVASKTGSVTEAGQTSQAQDHHATLRDRRYRYIRCANGEEELYDHQEDPYEWRNVVQDAAYQEVKQAMQRRLLHLTQ